MIKSDKIRNILPIVIVALSLTVGVTISNGASITPYAHAQNETSGTLQKTFGGVTISTSKGEIICYKAPDQTPKKIDGLSAHAFMRHGALTGQFTLVSPTAKGEDNIGTISGGEVSSSTYKLTGKETKDVLCPTIYPTVIISGKCGDGVTVDMKSADGFHMASLKGNVKCSTG